MGNEFAFYSHLYFVWITYADSMFGHTHRHCVLYVQTIILLLRIDVNKTNEFNLLQSTGLSIIVPQIYLMDIGFEEKEKNERFLKSRLWGQTFFGLKKLRMVYCSISSIHPIIRAILYGPLPASNIYWKYFSKILKNSKIRKFSRWEVEYFSLILSGKFCTNLFNLVCDYSTSDREHFYISIISGICSF